MSERERLRTIEKLVTPEDRRLVVDPFNKYYYSLYQKYEVKPKVYYDSYFTLTSSIESAIGSEIEDPAHAIPASYEGDGSVEIAFRTIQSEEVTRREGLPMDFFDSYNGEGKEILEVNSIPFLPAGTEHYEDRVRFEAELMSQNRKNAVGSDNRPEKVKLYVADATLRRRRELMLPVVGQPKTTPDETGGWRRFLKHPVISTRELLLPVTSRF